VERSTPGLRYRRTGTTFLPNRERAWPAASRLAGKKGLVLGVAGAQGIAYRCAAALRASGAELAIAHTHGRPESSAGPFEEFAGPIVMPCSPQAPGELEAVFAAIRRQWGRLDFALHAVAHAPRDEERGRLIDSSAAGFARAMDVSCHSFVRMAQLAEPLMSRGGTLLATTFYGAQREIEPYDVMGPVKAALDAVVLALERELGPQGIRVHALSLGPVPTPGPSGMEHFDELLAQAALLVPKHHLATIDDVGSVAAGLVGNWGRL
jgi:enoyl-[acyl-carrier protein] reductase I